MQDMPEQVKTVKTDTLRRRPENAPQPPAEKTFSPHPLRLIPLPPYDTMTVT